MKWNFFAFKAYVYIVACLSISVPTEDFKVTISVITHITQLKNLQSWYGCKFSCGGSISGSNYMSYSSSFTCMARQNTINIVACKHKGVGNFFLIFFWCRKMADYITHNSAVVMKFPKTRKPSGGRRSWRSFKENSLNLKILLAVFIMLHEKEAVSII